MSFMGQYLSRGGPSRVIDPWDFLDPVAFPAAECRTILITDAIRSQDALRRSMAASGDTAAAWRERIRSVPATQRPRAAATRSVTTPAKKGGRGQSPEQPAREVRKTPATAPAQSAPPVPKPLRAEPTETEGERIPMAHTAIRTEVAVPEPVRLEERPAVQGKSDDELLADQVWKSLTVEDKWALLEAAS